jgi:hypothetical protein
MGTNLLEPANWRAEMVGIRSHELSASPRQYWLEHLDCDSCCRGFESHQPPQYSCGFQRSRLVTHTGKNSHRGNTRHPVNAAGGAAALGRRAVIQYCTALCENTGCQLLASRRQSRARPLPHAFSNPERGLRLASLRTQQVGAFLRLRSGRRVTQLMGECRRRTQDSDAAHDPSGAALCRDRSEPAIDPPCDWLSKRAPGSLNAPLLARSRPTQVFQGCRLAENSMMWGVTGSPLRHQVSQPPSPPPQTAELDSTMIKRISLAVVFLSGFAFCVWVAMQAPI